MASRRPTPTTRGGQTTKWSKTYAVHTRRMQANLGEQAARSALEKRFRGAPVGEKFYVTGFYRWDDVDYSPNELLGDGLSLLDDVRVSCRVFIDYDESNKCIRLHANDDTSIEKGLAGLKMKIKHAEADAAAMMPLYIVDPPAYLTKESTVRPAFRPSDRNRRPVVDRVVLCRPITSSSSAAAEWEQERTRLRSANQETLTKHLKQAFTHFQRLVSGMQMCVNFGQFQLQVYRKDFAESAYTYEKFASMMAESRTKANFDKNIKTSTFASGFLNAVKSAGELLEPADSLTSSLGEVKPQHHLEVIAHGTANSRVRLEADIDQIEGATGRQGPGMWQIGATAYFDHDGRKSRLTTGSISLESFDWCLEAVSEEPMSQVPGVFREILASIAFARSEQAIADSPWQFPFVAPRAAPGCTIGEYCVRSVFQYRVKSTLYVLEFVVCRGWKGGRSHEPPSQEYQVRLYHSGWDNLIGSDLKGQPSDGWDWNSFFGATPNTTPGLDQFLTTVQALQALMAHIYTGTN